ncbi:DMBT1 protein, partial [Casuarius casuarius]|nr:DMBT1 protein [Casuarius casuarius]
CAGRVEVKLQGQWGTVADGIWDMEDAEVVCQQLGCGSAKSAHDWTRFGKGSGPIHLAVVDCRGNESTLWECTIKGWGLYNGSHGRDVGVVCQGKSRGGHGPGCLAPGATSYTGFRLVNGSTECAGRVELEARGTWGSLCDTSWDMPDAQVLCHHLGCG